MTLGQHLVELRRRLFRSAISLLIGSGVGWFAAPLIWNALRAPIEIIAHAHRTSINYTTVSAAFDVRMQVAIAAGIVISSPAWLSQLFAFLVPGLKRRERRYIFGFFFSAVPLFLGGCVAGWYVVPHVVEVMMGFVPPQDSSIVDAKTYLDFVVKLVLATGIAFVLPVFLVLLDFVGVITARSILRGWRWAVLAITLFTAIATPAADVMSMFLLAAPMIALYFLAVGVAFAHDRVASRRAAELRRTEQLLLS